MSFISNNSQPNKGRGLRGELANALGVSSTMISFLMSRTKSLNLEQASDLADYLGLSESQTDYLFLLVDYERAGHQRLREKLKRKIEKSREQSLKVSARVPKDKELTDSQKATFYSSWIYTGIRNLVATENFKNAQGIARRLNLPLASVNQALRFLLENHLCLEKLGKIEVGPAYTHLDEDSPLVNKHRQNWRLRGIQQMDLKNGRDFFYACPMSLSEADSHRIKSLLLTAISETLEIVRPSKSERVHCLNIDWFEY